MRPEVEKPVSRWKKTEMGRRKKQRDGEECERTTEMRDGNKDRGRGLIGSRAETSTCLGLWKGPTHHIPIKRSIHRSTPQGLAQGPDPDS